MSYNGFHILLFLSVFLTSCASDFTESITGSWKVKAVILSSSDSSDFQSGLKSELQSMTFDFKSDGLLLHSNFFRNGAHGTWALSANSDSLVCNYQYQRATYTDVYSIEKKDGQSFILTSSSFEGIKEITLEITPL